MDISCPLACLCFSAGETVINFNQLRAFHEVARNQGFSAAARALCVTQPAVTSHIRGLESSLGVRLFRRTPREDSRPRIWEVTAGCVTQRARAAAEKP